MNLILIRELHLKLRLCSQCTITGTFEENQVVKRRDCILNEMVKSVSIATKLSKQFWDKVSNMGIQNLNKFLKNLSLNNVEFLTKRKCSASHYFVLVYSAEMRTYGYHSEKLSQIV